MTSCQHLTLPQQHQHIVDSELEPPTPHYQYVMSPLTNTHLCLHRSNIKSTTLTSTCINFSNITHLHNISTCIESTSPASLALTRLSTILHHRIQTDDLDVGSELGDLLSSKPGCTSVGVTGCRSGCRAPKCLDFMGLTRTSTLGMVIHFYSPSFSKFRARFGAQQLGCS
jgi:hypothetical protein